MEVFGVGEERISARTRLQVRSVNSGVGVGASVRWISERAVASAALRVAHEGQASRCAVILGIRFAVVMVDDLFVSQVRQVIHD